MHVRQPEARNDRSPFMDRVKKSKLSELPSWANFAWLLSKLLLWPEVLCMEFVERNTPARFWCRLVQLHIVGITTVEQ